MELNLKNQNQKLILTDVDGVLLDWEYAFDIYMQQHGFNKIADGGLKYNIGTRYNISSDQGKKLIKIFNESAHIGFLPPLRDAMYYVKKLVEEHGYRFHAITALSLDPNACELRKMNLQKLFGKVAFDKFVFVDTGADKDQALEPYRDSGCFWVEDKIVNCQLGRDFGLRSLLMEHGHNMEYDDPEIPRVRNWREIYEIVTG
jgi:hypothetical protein